MTAAPPAPAPRGLRALLGVRPADPQWPVALRTAVCIVLPAVVGLLAGDLPAGLMASLGGFVGLYGSGRPYLNRLRLLFTVAVSLSVAVGLGIWAGGNPWLSLLLVVVIATVATWTCNAFSVEPGAYQFALSCAAGSVMFAAGADPLRSALLVLAGGLLACVAPLTAALVDPRGPERHVVGAAAEAVADFLDALGTPEVDAAQETAVRRMHEAWIALVNQQPNRRHPGRGLLRLRETARQLQLMLADGLRRRSAEPGSAARARRLGRSARRRVGEGRELVLSGLPLGRPSAVSLLRNALDPRSRSLLVILRVAVAAAVAGTIGSLFGLANAYWAVATTVLVLSSGLDQRRTVQRGLERTLGTFVGVGVTAAVLWPDPPDLAVLGVIGLAVYAGQLLVPRNYAAASVFITCSALLMTGASRPGADAGMLLWSRALDTAVGCLVALGVFAVLSRKGPAAWLPDALSDTLGTAAAAVDQLTPSTIASPAGLRARRDLVRSLLRLTEAYENAINGFGGQREQAERTWPTLVAVQRLGYRVLAEGWRLQDGPDRSTTGPSEPPPSAGVRRLAEAALAGRVPTGRAAVPSFLSRDVADVRRVLTAMTSTDRDTPLR